MLCNAWRTGYTPSTHSTSIGLVRCETGKHHNHVPPSILQCIYSSNNTFIRYYMRRLTHCIHTAEYACVLQRVYSSLRATLMMSTDAVSVHGQYTSSHATVSCYFFAYCITSRSVTANKLRSASIGMAICTYHMNTKVPCGYAMQAHVVLYRRTHSIHSANSFITRAVGTMYS